MIKTSDPSAAVTSNVSGLNLDSEVSAMNQPKAPKVARSDEETEQAFRSQLRFLRNSCSAYDVGDAHEAARMAVAMRVLLHDSGAKSRSLLAQLGRTHLRFLNTATRFNPHNLLTHQGLVVIHLGGEEAWRAPLDEPPVVPEWVPFVHWWNAIVISDDRRDTFSRVDLVRYVANQDGGAHVDPEMDERYARLKRNQSSGWHLEHADGSVGALTDLVTASVRQIAHEVLRTLEPRSPADAAASMQPGRNDPCPCGAGRKYKKCHGAEA